MQRVLLPVIGLLLLVASAAGTRADAQETAVRFEISGVADSTFSFATGRHPWVARGQRGIVVDPRRRDALVARFQVTRVEDGLATAVVTGQTAPLSTQHAALLTQPSPPFWKHAPFWVGLLIGGIAGWAIGS